MAISVLSTDDQLVRGNGDSDAPSVSADGRYAVFSSDASNLVAGDTNGVRDIFYRDTLTGTITRISTDGSGNQGDSLSYNPFVSADGRYVVFSSNATNLVAGDTNGTADVFCKDIQTGALTRISTASNDAQSNNTSYNGSISADGRYVVFQSFASNLVSGDTNGDADIFLKDRQTGVTTRLSTSSGGSQADGDSSEPSISANGIYVVFSSLAANLVSGDTNGEGDVFMKNRLTGTLTRISTDSSGVQGDDLSTNASISADGSFVAFGSRANNLVSGDTNIAWDIFRKDIQSGVVTRLSTDVNGVAGNGDTFLPSISADGRYVAFRSNASNLVTGDTNAKPDIFFKDSQSGAILRLSTDANGVEGNGESLELALSADARYVVFSSLATNLVSGDTNGASDVFRVEALATLGLPEITVSPDFDVFDTFANLSGTVVSAGSSPITEVGFVFSITSFDATPTLGEPNSASRIGTLSGDTFFAFINGLPSNTSITFAAYAKNQFGTTYSEYITFTTLPSPGQLPGITVWNVNGTFYIYGTSQDDTIAISSNAPQSIVVSSNQPINGLPSPQSFTFTRAQATITVTALGGNDDVTIAAPLNLDGVQVHLGTGNNRLVLGADPNNPINNNVLDPQFGTLGYLTVNGPLFVTGEDGNDRVIERSTVFDGEKTIRLGEGNNEYNVYWGFSNDTNFSSGAGQDNIYIGYLSSRAVSQFDTGAGNDLISYYASRFYKTAYLNSGAGYDTVALDVNIYDDAVTVDTGSEADYLLFSRSIAYKSIVLTTGSGADTVLIGKYISGLNSSGAAVYSNGGSNIDQLTLNTGTEADAVQIAANVMRLFYADLGDALDAADVEYNIFTDGLLDGAGQGMRLRNKSNTGLRTRNISG
jgi:Tol biopolymer transport system component